MAAIFHKFQALPLELRNQIWRDALPENDEPALFPWKKGCWGPQRLRQSKKESNSDEQQCASIHFCGDLLDHVRVEVPLFFVNWEARDIAVAWMRKQNITVCYREGNQRYIFTRAFNPELDTLYIPPKMIYDFLMEPFKRLDEPDVHNRGGIIAPSPTRIAVPAAILQSDSSSILEIFGLYISLKELLVVVNPQPDWENPEIQQVQGCRWEIERNKGKAFFFNFEIGLLGLHEGTGKLLGDVILYMQIEEVLKKLGRDVASAPRHPVCDIGPVIVNRKSAQ